MDPIASVENTTSQSVGTIKATVNPSNAHAKFVCDIPEYGCCKVIIDQKRTGTGKKTYYLDHTCGTFLVDLKKYLAHDITVHIIPYSTEKAHPVSVAVTTPYKLAENESLPGDQSVSKLSYEERKTLIDWHYHN